MGEVEDPSVTNTNENDETNTDAKDMKAKEIKVESIDDELRCKICGNEFVTKSGCVSHARYCEKNLAKRFCKLCEEQFKSDQDFKLHMKTEHPVKTEKKKGQKRNSKVASAFNLKLKLDYGCPKCDRKFKQSSHFKLHTKTCNGLTLEKFCKQCNVKFCSETSLRRHMRRRHTERKEEEVPDCENCGRCFKRKSDRTKHINMGCGLIHHINISCGLTSEENGNEKLKTVDCEECGIKFSRLKELKRHQVVGCKEDAKKKMKVCPICKISFTDRTGFRRHMETQHGGLELYTCDVCNLKFNSDYTLERHMTHHREEKRHICEICGNDFKFREGLNRHLKKHAGLRFFCDQCPKSFTARHSLKKHKLWHEGLRPFICDKCGDTFREKTKLARHMILHAGIRSHECKTCHKKFVLKEYLKSHERMHTSQKTLYCDMCPYKTFRPESIRTHKKTHFMRRDFRCDICERMFSQKHSLEYHKRLHQKPGSKCRPAFVTKPTLFCNQCPRGFTTQRGLVRHAQKHTKGILPVCRPGGVKGKLQDENPENDVPQPSENTVPQFSANTFPQFSENNDLQYSDKPKSKKRKRSELSAGEMSNVNTLNNKNKDTLGETGTLIKSTISGFSDMNITQGIVVPMNSHGIQVMNNEMFNAIRWAIPPDGRMEHAPHMVVGNRGTGLQGGEMYHSMSDVERRVAHAGVVENDMTTMDRNRKIIREPVFGRESAFGLYAPSNMITTFENVTSGMPHWTSCRFSQPQDLSSKFSTVHGEFGKGLESTKVVDANEAGYDKNNQSRNMTAVNDKPLSLVRHDDDHDDAFDEDTDIEDYGDNLQFDSAANVEDKAAIKKESSENSRDDDFTCDVQCNKCNAKFFSFNQLKTHLVQGCGKTTGRK